MAKRKLVTRRSIRAGQTIYLIWIDSSTPVNKVMVSKILVLPDTHPNPESGCMLTEAPVSYIVRILKHHGTGCKLFHSKRKAMSHSTDEFYA